MSNNIFTIEFLTNQLNKLDVKAKTIKSQYFYLCYVQKNISNCGKINESKKKFGNIYLLWIVNIYPAYSKPQCAEE